MWRGVVVFKKYNELWNHQRVLSNPRGWIVVILKSKVIYYVIVGIIIEFTL